MNDQLNSLFPHVVTPELGESIVKLINDTSYFINNEVSSYFPDRPSLPPNYSSRIRFEMEYKQTITETIKYHIREISLLKPPKAADLNSPAFRDEYLRWTKLLEDGLVIPQVNITWHRIANGFITWTLVSISWTISDTTPQPDHPDTSFRLPPQLDSPRAHRMLQAFIDEGLVQLLPDGHAHWLLNHHNAKSPASFAYFVIRASDYLKLTTRHPDSPARYARKPFESLFQIHDTAKKPNIKLSAKTRKKIDAVFDQLKS